MPDLFVCENLESYFLTTNYALSKVIVNGDSPPPKRTVDGVEQTYPPTTTEEKLARKNELKAKDGYVNHKSQKIPKEDWKEGWAPRENRNKEPVRRNVTMETTNANSLVAQDGFGYDWSDQAKDGPINFALMAYTSLGVGYHAVPPPYTGNFMPSKPNLILVDVDEYVVSESVTSVPDVAINEAKTSESKPKSVSEPLIEDWVFDSEDANDTETKSK
nr:hypothetical protein [Tanacetum cinerariifolium]